MNINFNNSFEEMNQQIMMQQYQNYANRLIDSYDYNDIKKAIKHAKAKISSIKKTYTIEESISILNKLFNATTKWLRENGREV